MYTGIKYLHSFTAYITLACLIIAILYAFYHLLSSKPHNKWAKITSLLGLISTHIQLLFGLLMYFVSPFGLTNFSREAMKDTTFRMYILEHPLMMIIAVILITYGYIKSKRATSDKSKFKFVAIYFSLGLITILLRIPWNAWL